MLQQVKRITAGRSVLCAVSGGADSVVLLHLLKQSGAKVVAAHMEHGIRGEASLRDCAFVQRLCSALSIELVVEHADVPEAAQASGCGIEETARRLRYAFLRRQKEALQLDCIATAHHLNDQAETLLLHITRGASPAGLAGMRVEQDDLIRPLLPFTREQIQAYARENALEFVQDETNDDIAYSRNRIRHCVLPQMECINPQAVQAMGRLAAITAQQQDYIAQQAQALLAQKQQGDHLADVRQVHPGLRDAAVHRYLTLCGVKEAESADVARLMRLFDRQNGKRASIGGRQFEKDAAGVHLVQGNEAQGSFLLHMGINDTPLGRFVLEEAPVPQKLDLGRCSQVLDAEKAGNAITVRTRRTGDRVQLLGSKGSRLLSDVMTDKKIPRSERERVPLIERDGEIIWIAGIAPCRACAVERASKRALIIHYEKGKDCKGE